jgi:hypothetical protein
VQQLDTTETTTHERMHTTHWSHATNLPNFPVTAGRAEGGPDGRGGRRGWGRSLEIAPSYDVGARVIMDALASLVQHGQSGKPLPEPTVRVPKGSAARPASPSEPAARRT